mmetsp:Transcript_65260/g.185246  ORF Transcript_65260/g.185246 Transcript_65260/m.185246 type:complete len:283 (-) Transcript_65260:283-1131(-)
MEPMPMPTRRASTPESMRCFACRFVTTLPPMTWRSGNCCFIHLTMSCWNALSPWLLSTTMASTPAATSAVARVRSSGRVPMLAATRNCLFASLVASGYSAFFLRSVRAIRATRKPVFETMGSFPFLVLWMISFAACSSTPSSAVTSSSTLVMTWLTEVPLRSLTKSQSRRVTNPSSLDPILPSEVTGKPVKPHVDRTSSSSASAVVGFTQMGSVMKPLLYFLTFVTSSTWSSMDILLWMTPMPPSRAMPIAILASVTVSMGLETRGVFNVIFLVKLDSRVTS